MIEIGNRRELFIDNYLIDQLDGAQLRLHRPCSGGVALHFDEPWAYPSAGYCTILKDSEKYMLYYRKTLEGAIGDDAQTQVTCYAESADGITWSRPNLGLFGIKGSRENNVVHAGLGPASHNFSPFIDIKPGVPPSQRFKALAGTDTTGLLGFVSPDGIHWKQLREEPLLPRVPGAYRYDSQNVAFWSEHEGCYLCYFRAWKNKVRTIARAVSDDFLHWSDGDVMDFGNTKLEHLYINQTHPYFRAPHIYIALAARFMPGRKILSDEEGKAFNVGSYKGVGYWQDCSEAVLLTSRGGNRYDRTFLEGFVRPGIDRRNWVSRCTYPALGVVPTGPTEMSLYATRHNEQPTSHLERFALRTDGFASLSAPFAGGEMVTKPFQFKGQELVINYATGAGGHVRVEIQDASGKAIDGYTRAQSTMIIGDEIERIVSWEKGSDVSRLAGQPIRLRFELMDADVYSLQFR